MPFQKLFQAAERHIFNVLSSFLDEVKTFIHKRDIMSLHFKFYAKRVSFVSNPATLYAKPDILIAVSKAFSLPEV